MKPFAIQPMKVNQPGEPASTGWKSTCGPCRCWMNAALTQSWVTAVHRLASNRPQDAPTIQVR
jgi:hypothetical protein